MSVNGRYSFRLKQIDYDGSYEYSDEININFNTAPQEFFLEQNYPNPFDPLTMIRFQLPEQSQVTLKVFDIIGSEITCLVNNNLEPGSYDIEFNASDLSNGIYFYRIQTDKYVSTKKMLLLK